MSAWRLTLWFWLWLCFVALVAGLPAAFFSAVTGLAVCFAFFWEAGEQRAGRSFDSAVGDYTDVGQGAP
jgi:hypothetical protein